MTEQEGERVTLADDYEAWWVFRVVLVLIAASLIGAVGLFTVMAYSGATAL